MSKLLLFMCKLSLFRFKKKLFDCVTDYGCKGREKEPQAG